MTGNGMGLRASAAGVALIPPRVVLGIIFIIHGGQKLFGLFGGHGLEGMAGMLEKMGFVPAKFWAMMAGGAEFFGGIAVLIGCLTRLGAAGIAIVMAVAILKVHWSAGLVGEGGYEYPLANFAMALTLLLAGAGPYSVDRWFSRKR